MSSKSIILSGILAVSLLILGCLRFHLPSLKEKYLQKVSVSKVETEKNETAEKNESKKFVSLKEVEKNLSLQTEEDNISKEIRKEIFTQIPSKEEAESNVTKEELLDSEKISEAFEVETEISQILFDNPIKFRFASASLTKESRKTLREIAEKLKELKNVEIEVAGYTDAKGDENFNKTLSLQRAESVRRYLIKRGVDKNIITAKGYGESNFIYDPNDKRNRRVEIHIKERK